MIYKTVDIENASLTLYILDNYPDINPNRKRPFIMVVPGGGYEFCSERETEAIAIRFCALGFNTAVIRYTTNDSKDRESQIYPIPQMQLAKSIAYVRENASSLNTDENKIVVMGFSAGGHLTASMGCLWKQYDKNARPDAIVLSYPVISSGQYAHRGSFDCLCGKNNLKLQKELSLENCVNKDNPPTFMWHTKTDELVPVENSFLFKEALDKQGIKNKLVLFEEGEHGMSLASKEVFNKKHHTEDAEIAKWPELVRDWLKELFGDDWYLN